MFALIAVLVILIAAVAVVRSFNTSLFQSGNLAFKRDLTNQSELAMNLAFEKMRSGSLATEAQRADHAVAENFSAAILPVNAQGIPNALLSDAAFSAVGIATNDVALHVRWLGKVPYREALALQQSMFERGRGDHLLLLEHAHVFVEDRHETPVEAALADGPCCPLLRYERQLIERLA